MTPLLWSKDNLKTYFGRLLGMAFVSGAVAFCMGCEREPALEIGLGERALAEVNALITAHPQREAGVRSEAVAAWIAGRLGESAVLQRFETPHGTMVNVVKPHPEPVAILASHYDTKRGIPGFVGANDGASTTALLLTLAAETDLPVTYLFLDGEECREAYTAKDGLHGSWHFAKTEQALKQARVPVIVLDMLGDKVFTPGLAANGSLRLNGLIRRAAKRVGMRLSDAGEIIDDHLPFTVEGWQAADIIDFDYGPENSWWHTPEDTVDKLSAHSLAQAAMLVKAIVKDLIEEQQ
jgi:Zn-dependent M28 family amino/carboxypeptidase